MLQWGAQLSLKGALGNPGGNAEADVAFLDGEGVIGALTEWWSHTTALQLPPRPKGMTLSEQQR